MLLARNYVQVGLRIGTMCVVSQVLLPTYNFQAGIVNSVGLYLFRMKRGFCAFSGRCSG